MEHPKTAAQARREAHQEQGQRARQLADDYLHEIDDILDANVSILTAPPSQKTYTQEANIIGGTIMEDPRPNQPDSAPDEQPSEGTPQE